MSRKTSVKVLACTKLLGEDSTEERLASKLIYMIAGRIQLLSHCCNWEPQFFPGFWLEASFFTWTSPTWQLASSKSAGVSQQHRSDIFFSRNAKWHPITCWLEVSQEQDLAHCQWAWMPVGMGLRVPSEESTTNSYLLFLISSLNFSVLLSELLPKLFQLTNSLFSGV